MGKSSLINTLLTRKRLVAVSSTPGKTRSIDFFRINDAFRFVDLPGYGYAKVPKSVQDAWKRLVEAYLGNRETLVSVVWILDIRRELSELDRMLHHWLRAYSVPYIPVCTKADKVSLGERARRQGALGRAIDPDAEPVLFSARTGLGKSVLWNRMRSALLHPPTTNVLRQAPDGPPRRQGSGHTRS